MPTNPLIYARFNKWILKAPIPQNIVKTRIMVGAPKEYEPGKRYLLPRVTISGKPWWIPINSDTRDSEVVAEFQPVEKYLDQCPVEPIQVPIPNSPSNYVDGEIYLVPQSETESRPHWKPL